MNFLLKNKTTNSKKKKNPKLYSNINFFFFFENLELFIWTSKTLKPNHSLYLLPEKSIPAFKFILKNELYFNRSMLLEASCIDLSQQNFEFKDLNLFFFKNKKIIYYSFYFFFLKRRMTFFFKLKNKMTSLDDVFSNSSWLEREFSEMYGVFFYKKKDIRNLLLDYGVLENPMLKDFPNTGFKEVIYDHLDKNIKYIDTVHVEL